VTSLSITTTILSAGIVVLVLRGTLRRLDIDAVRTAVAGILNAHRPQQLQIDLGAVLDVESAAAAAVTDLARETAAAGTTMTLHHASAHTRKQVALAGGEHLLR
jgi:ABC-type transporter Mla MlaB component